jgi:anti-anti-sigma factor
LVRALSESQKEGGQTKLLNAGPRIRQILEITRLDSVFEIYDDKEQAVASF